MMLRSACGARRTSPVVLARAGAHRENASARRLYERAIAVSNPSLLTILRIATLLRRRSWDAGVRNHGELVSGCRGDAVGTDQIALG
jgi:hypothetical protein